MDIVLNVLKDISLVIGLMGMWNIFIKYGKSGWNSIIPLVRWYRLGECAGKEKDGFFMMIFSGIINLLNVIDVFFPYSSNEDLLIDFLIIILSIPHFIFNIRVYLGITESFGKRKRWILVWLFSEALAFLIFGFRRDFKPDEKYLRTEDGSPAANGMDVSGDGEGLLVNIKSRSVINFFKRYTLLRDIHLMIPRGHMVLLLGGSGAGKTTFLNAVTGYEKADADIELGKFNVYRDYGRMKYDIGFVPQADLMRDTDTVYRTIADAASLRLTTEMTYAEKKQRVDEVLDIFGLTALKNSLVSKLSGGQRKRLSIAIEYISYPTMFILDEPDSGLDGVVAKGLFRKLREIADTNKIVIVITHTPDRVIEMFDDVIVLAKDSNRTGRLAYYGPVKEAYEFFGKSSMEDILLSINQKEEGGEGRAEEFVASYNDSVRIAGGEA